MGKRRKSKFPTPPKSVASKEESAPVPKKRRRNKLRETAFKRLKTLPNYDDMRDKVCAGISCEEVARWLQEDCGLCGDVKYIGLVRQLYRFRDSIPTMEREFKEVSAFNKSVELFAHKVSTLEEMTKLFELQTKRIGLAIDIEDRTKMPLPVLGHEIDRAQSLLHSIARLKGELGLLDKTGERLIGDSDGVEESTLAAGALAVLRSRHGPEAVDKLLYAGKKLQESLSRLVRKPSGDDNGKVPITVTDSGVEVHTTSETPHDESTGAPTK